MSPLCDALIPMAFEADMNETPREDRKTSLKKSDWPDQVKAGINRAMGIEITWV